MDRLTMKLVRDWLQPQVPTGVTVVTGNRTPDGPDRIVKIAMMPGAGLAHEGIFDQPAISTQCRGAQNNYEDAEYIALSVDDVFLQAGHPLSMGSVWVSSITRLSGAPAELEQADSQERTRFTADYVLMASTGV